jgi:predicted ATPase
VCRSRIAWTLWYLGYPDQGRTQTDEAVTLAQRSAYPFSLAFALSLAAGFHQLRREGHTAQAYAEAAMSLTTEQGFPHWRAYSAIMRGWALAHQGQAQEGIEQINQSLRAYRATGAELWWSYFLGLLAEAYSALGQPEAGLTALTEARTFAETTGARFYEAEVYRLTGMLLLQQSSDHQGEAEAYFHQAIVIAQNQQAKSLELRAATSLARLWQNQGKRDEAQQVLGDIHGWFTEGFDTADLKDAKALLYALEDGR